MAFVLWVGMAGAQQAGTEEIIEPAPAMPKAPAIKHGRVPFFAPQAATQAKRLAPEQSHERRFLKDLAASLRLQSQASQMVMKRSDNPAVRELAQAVAAWERSITPELLRLLNERGMALPIIDKEQSRALKQLQKLRGRASDRHYVEEIIRLREADLVYFQETAAITTDPGLKQWIESQLEELRYQLTLAQRALPGEPGRPV